MIEGLLFDVGDVLVSYDGRSARQKIATSSNVNADLFQETWDQLMPLLGTGQLSEEDFWGKLFELIHIQKEVPDLSFFTREYSSQMRVNQDVMEIVKSLKLKGYRLAVVSNTIKPHADFNNQIGVYDDFDTVVLSHEVGVRKPNPLIFTTALDRIKIAPEQVVLIDDSEENIIVARELGMKGIAFRYPEKLKKDLRSFEIRIT